MAKTISLKASTRNGVGRTALKTVRGAGKIPAVLYGKKGSRAIEIDAKELKTVLHGLESENVLVDLHLSDDKASDSHLALIQDVQHHPLKDIIVHLDLHEIARDEKLKTEVPIVEIGEAAGVRTGGGLLEVIMRQVMVECLPQDLPEHIEVDVTALEIGQSIHVSDLKLPANVRVLNDASLSVIIVAAPKTEEEKPAGAAEVAQPEMIKEKKTEEGGGDSKKPEAKKADAKK
jgi:large subunit ribosomal protein L25